MKDIKDKGGAPVSTALSQVLYTRLPVSSYNHFVRTLLFTEFYKGKRVRK